MSEIKVYAVKRLWTCRMNYYRGHTTTVTARAVAALEENTLRILQTLWVQEGSIPVGIKLIERVAGGHVATGVELDILRDQSIVVMTRDCWRLFSDLEEKNMFHAYEESYTASNLEDEVRRTSTPNSPRPTTSRTCARAGMKTGAVHDLAHGVLCLGRPCGCRRPR